MLRCALASSRPKGRLRGEAILEGALELFTERGYDATTMTEIAARSGTSVGSLYRWFPCKESIADALLLECAQEVTGQLAALETQAATISVGKLAVAFRIQIRFSDSARLHNQSRGGAGRK
jgi:AcrR family transcriptional regulator